MNGRLLAWLIIGSAILGGAGLYYQQIFAYYEQLDADQVDVRISRGAFSGSIEARNLMAINADSSPIRFRACFDVSGSVTVGAERYPDAEPRNAPFWFACFKAGQIGSDLETGAARAFLGEENIVYGIDRVLAIYPDGRGYAWHQINDCGEQVFAGRPAPAGCPARN